MKHKLYTAEVAPELAEQFSDWRPITDLADEIKIVSHSDGTCEIYFRIAPAVMTRKMALEIEQGLATNGDGQHQ